MRLGWISFVSDSQYFSDFITDLFYEDYSSISLYPSIANLAIL